jgi:hypothetical protein
MNCRQFDQVVVDMARDVSVEGTAQGAVDHAWACLRCAVRLSEHRKLAAALRAVNAATSKEQAPAGVEHSLLRAFRAGFDALRPAPSVQAVPPRRSSALAWWVWPVAVAAILLLGLVVERRLRTTPVQRVERASSPPVTDKKAAAFGNGNAQTGSAIVRRGVSLPRRTASYGRPSKQVATPDKTATGEVTMRFYPLPYGSGLGLDEGWGLVRVQLPRASLASLGVPVSGGSANEMLTADVVVGQDGLARGIRFVQ